MSFKEEFIYNPSYGPTMTTILFQKFTDHISHKYVRERSTNLLWAWEEKLAKQNWYIQCLSMDQILRQLRIICILCGRPSTDCRVRRAGRSRACCPWVMPVLRSIRPIVAWLTLIHHWHIRPSLKPPSAISAFQPVLNIRAWTGKKTTGTSKDVLRWSFWPKPETALKHHVNSCRRSQVAK